MLDKVEIAQLKSAKGKIIARTKVLTNMEVARLAYLEEMAGLRNIIDRLEQKKKSGQGELCKQP